MTKKKSPSPDISIMHLERLDDIHRELKKMNEQLEDMSESRKSEKAEFSFLLSLVGVAISVSSLLVRALSGNDTVLLVGGGISILLLITVASYMNRLSRTRPVPKEIIFMLAVLFAVSTYCILLGVNII